MLGDLIRRYAQVARKPVWITEYGILLPEEYGFTTEQVEVYMLDSFDLFDTLRHDELGLAEDEGRLVQRWAWFSTVTSSKTTT